jgi:1-deoxy-D-xylulose-5-phosphate synthase
MMPKDENELRHMLFTSLHYNQGPIAVRYPRIQGLGVTLDPVLRKIPIGEWEITREGNDVAVLAVGTMVRIAELTAHELEKEGISVRIINARFIKPLDEQMLLTIGAEDLPIITIEEGAIQGGFGSSVLEWYALHQKYNMRIFPLGIPDIFVEHGSIDEQRLEVGLTTEHLAERVRSILNQNMPSSSLINK